MKLLTRALLLCTLCATAWGDVVLDWNQAALEAVRARNIPPPRVARDLAILHLAIHDAVNSIARTHESYAFTGRVPAAASRQAAAATAGYLALTALFPHPEDQAMFATLYAQQLSMIPDLPPKRMSILSLKRGGKTLTAEHVQQLIDHQYDEEDVRVIAIAMGKS